MLNIFYLKLYTAILWNLCWIVVMDGITANKKCPIQLVVSRCTADNNIVVKEVNEWVQLNAPPEPIGHFKAVFVKEKGQHYRLCIIV